MSHGLANRNDMVFVGATPWHKLGRQLDRYATIGELRNDPYLGYTVRKDVLFRRTNTGEYLQVDNGSVILRNDTDAALTLTGPDYTCVQNWDVVEKAVDKYLTDGKGYIETAGVLYGGRKFWCALRLDQMDITLPGGDELKTYIVVGNSFNASESVSVMAVNTRVVCQNTYGFAEQEAGDRIVRIRHEGDVLARIGNALPELGYFQKTRLAFLEAAKAMQQRTFRKDQAVSYLKDLYPVKAVAPVRPEAPTPTGNEVEDFRAKLTYDAALEAWETDYREWEGGLTEHAEKILEIIDTQPGYDLSPGTVWQLFNAVTYYNDHVQLRRGADSKVNNTLLKGEGVLVKRRAFQSAITLLQP